MKKIITILAILITGCAGWNVQVKLAHEWEKDGVKKRVELGVMVSRAIENGKAPEFSEVDKAIKQLKEVFGLDVDVEPCKQHKNCVIVHKKIKEGKEEKNNSTHYKIDNKNELEKLYKDMKELYEKVKKEPKKEAPKKMV